MPSCDTTHVSCGCGELRPLLWSGPAQAVSGLRRRAVGVLLCASRAPISDLESYPYRIGTVHMCRDAAYADAGVHSGALPSLRGWFNFSGAALDV